MSEASLSEIGDVFQLDLSSLGENIGRQIIMQLTRNGGIQEGLIFRFHFNDDNKEQIFEYITDLLADWEIELKADAKTNSFIAQKADEERRFSEFSVEAFNIRNNIDAADGLREFADVISKSMTRTPYPRQMLSAYHMAFARNSCNFSVPGTGKTTVVFAAYSYLNSLEVNNPKHLDKILVIGPLSSFGPWEKEFKKCFGRNPVMKKILGISQDERGKYYRGITESAELTLMSYQTAANDVELIERFLSLNPNTMIVLDEAHRIKNTSNEAIWSQAILKLANSASSRIVLTGTPAPNKISDLWNYFKFIWPSEHIISFPLGFLDNISRKEHKDRLISDISPFFIRIKKSDLKLPEAINVEPIYVPMDEAQAKIYEYLEGGAVANFEEFKYQDESTDVLRKAKMIRLRQCASNPKLLKAPLLAHYKDTGHLGIANQEIVSLIQSYDATPQKFLALLNLVNGIFENDGPKGKIIIWSNFVMNLKYLSDFLSANEIDNRLLIGEVPTETDETPADVETRQKIIDEFHQSECSFRVILANPAAVGESISLHHACHNAVYFEKDWNAATFMQSKDRIHRYGLKPDDKIQYYYLLTEDSVDLDIHSTVLRKEQTMLEIIEKEEIPIFSALADDEFSKSDVAEFLRSFYERKGNS